MNQVKLNPNVDNLLTKISIKRKKDGSLNSTKQAIVAELVMGLHKKECKS